MFYWGRLIGFFISIIFGHSLSNILLAIFIGSIIDRINEMYSNNQYFNNEKIIKNLYFQTTFEVMGYVSKSKGFISIKDIKMTLSLMKEMNLNKKDILFAQNSFKKGKQNDYPLINKLNNLYEISFDKNNNLLDKFIEAQIKIAFINDYLNNKTKKILFTIFNELNIPEEKIKYFINKLIINHSVKKFFFKDFFKYYKYNYNNYYYNYFDNFNFYNNDDYYQDYNYFNQDYNNNYKQDDNNQLNIDKAYIILGVNKNDSMLKIKRSYRKLMSKYHPDKLISKGYSSEILEKAKVKTQNIQAAYNIIKNKKFH
ncbi:co-chaperone DjlA [Enterobacteriaceae endosymbiont of Plateumaris sericea]|uniref:co-chaperone DjlA n=1 Tax=Enterobacteriaceae endosymbiont of Plateumaris sericea TaxID=2675797 RepID=UPI001448B8E2|nr:co-chaperone DjlA [Enterobacteriaceae endosymbiont of Plateumaris sericea]QJC29910.1 co-chaperone DjlA [Enterobacteriaceae endosymbiont of Plateumaris sericea]